MSSQEEEKQKPQEEKQQPQEVVEKKAESPQKEEEEKKIKYLTMRTSDKVEIVVEDSTAMLSTTIKNLVEAVSASNVIPLQVESKVMYKVFEYCSMHVGEETANEDKIKALKGFDAKFAKELDVNMLYHLLMASNFLDIPGLLNLTTQETADRIKGKRPEEIRKMLNIKNDFTPEEEAEFNEKYPWAFDY